MLSNALFCIFKYTVVQIDREFDKYTGALSFYVFSFENSPAPFPD